MQFNDVKQVMSKSEVAKFYANFTVFVTGGTNILGKCLVEKLIRGCPDVKIVYVLIRTKDNENFEEKCKKYVSDDIFQTLRQINSKFSEKIKFLNGDLQQDNLGLSQQEYQILIDQVNLIFHNAANSANGKEKRRVTIALNTNIYGTKRVLELAAKCKLLECFAFVSTTCAQIQDSQNVKEIFYNPPGDLKYVNDMISADMKSKNGITNAAIKMLIGEWSNIFAFTKAIGEDMVRQHATTSVYPCCVFRPSVVISTYKEPVAGWCDEKNEGTIFSLKVAKGEIHGLFDFKNPVDVVPADLGANALLVAVRDATEERKSTKPKQAYIYNFCTSTENPINFRQIRTKIRNDPSAFRTSTSKRMPFICFVKSCWQILLVQILACIVPSLFQDTIGLFKGRAPENLSKCHEALRDICKVCHYVGKDWKITTDEMSRAARKLNSFDQELFLCDVKKLNWNDYFSNYWKGIKRYVLHESGDSGACCQHKCCQCCCLILAHLAIVMLYLAFAYYAVSLFF